MSLLHSLLTMGLAWLFTAQLYAQQLPYYSQYRYAQGMINPASVSSDFFLYDYNLTLQSAYRMQWIEQPETPRTLQLGLEAISNFGGAFQLVGGGNLLQDQIGPYSTTGVYGRLGSIFTKDPYFGGFGIGISYGFVNYLFNAGRVVWKDQDDPQIPLENFSLIRPEVGVGIFYYKRVGGRFFQQDNIYFGLSAPQLLAARETLLEQGQLIPFSRRTHFYGTAGWYHFFNQSVFLELSSWIKYVAGAPINVDLTARFQPGRTVWAGLGFNLNGLVRFEGGLNLPGFLAEDGNLKLGYAFDYSLTAFNLPFGGAHELIISYQMDTKRQRR